MAVTLKDVAEKAGVSIKTVSNVVNERPFIAEETRERVRQAIDALGYQPNLVARSLRKSPVGVMALALPNLANTYFSDIGVEIIAAAAAQSYTVLLDHTGGSRENEILIAHGLRQHLIDGVILNADSLTLDDLRTERIPLPLVLLGEHLYGAPWDHVVIDNMAAARQATAHLLRLGRRRVAFINMFEAELARMGESYTGPSRFRLAGYSAALAEAGLAVDPSLLLAFPIPDRAAGVAAVKTLLALARPPDAIFCFNDLLALGALRGLYDAGLRVPEDVAVVGIDDIEESAYATPSLTTISPDKRAIAWRAVELLIDRIQGRRTGPPERFELPFRLIERESTIGRARTNFSADGLATHMTGEEVTASAN